ncbi:kinase [Burkholderia paludis]|uniref:AAA family ATPase n=1 Tax=Burkholderia paludis TaxID=1506587 RepID=UPI0004DB6339|nr:AAA family ATPase [Burkholderia paludis]KFG95079.1 kinase [Burkholderia paludis]
MTDIHIINPDTFLETPAGRVWTPERSKAAWSSSFTALEAALAGHGEAPARLLVVCGVQGAGKSYWIDRHAHAHAPCICFDAALPGARHRKPIMDIARRYGAQVHAIWIDAPLHVAKARNARRPEDQRVPDASIDSVASLFEPPTLEEGFASVTRVEGD